MVDILEFFSILGKKPAQILPTSTSEEYKLVSCCLGALTRNLNVLLKITVFQVKEKGSLIVLGTILFSLIGRRDCKGGKFCPKLTQKPGVDIAWRCQSGINPYKEDIPMDTPCYA